MPRRLAVLQDGLRQKRQHRLFAFVAEHAQGNAEARSIVEQRVHAHRCALAAERERRPVADIAVP